MNSWHRELAHKARERYLLAQKTREQLAALKSEAAKIHANILTEALDTAMTATWTAMEHYAQETAEKLPTLSLETFLETGTLAENPNA